MRQIPAVLIGAALAISSTAAIADDHQAARLGVMVMSLTPELRSHFGAQEDRGVLVARVEPHSAAQASGIAVGDVIVAVRDHTIDDADDVRTTLEAVKPGATVPVKLVRDHRPLILQVRLTTQTSFLDPPFRDWLRSFPFSS